MHRSSLFRALPFAIAAAAAAGTGPAVAQDYDIDCKLLLCLPAGFPEGCGDALSHMKDRLRHGRSPIGFCGMGGGADYDDYEIDYEALPASRASGWTCDEGTSLYHRVRDTDDEGRRKTVNVFCYANSDTVRMGDTERTYYSGTTRAQRRDFAVDMRMNVSTDTPYAPGRMRFDTGLFYDWATTVHHFE